MKAVLLALNPRTPEPLEWTDTPPALRPVLDRSLVHHVIERLVDCGITNLVVVTEAQHDWPQATIGDGRRWGCSVTYVHSDGERGVVEAVRAAASESADALVALAAADRLPLCDKDPSAGCELVVVDRIDDGEMTRWGGWAMLPAACISEAAAGSSLSSLGDALVAIGEARGRCVTSDRWLDARGAGALLDSNRRALDSHQRGLLSIGREVEPGIWVGRNVRLGPGVSLVAPVFIGENTSIGARSTVGPHAAIGSACLVDADASVERSVVTAGTYVGEGLNVADAIVDGPTLVNVRLGASVRIDDGWLLAGTAGSRGVGATTPITGGPAAG